MLVGSQVSGFGGMLVVPSGNMDTSSSNNQMLTMKKGKSSNMPPGMRNQYDKMQQMNEQREQMQAATKYNKRDGLPVFNLFVRTPRKNMWYPCGSFKGDDKSKQLCQTIVDDGFMSGMASTQLDKGIAATLFRDGPKLKQQLFSVYPQLKSAKNDLTFAYKVSFAGFDEELIEVEPKQDAGGFLSNVKNMFSGGN